MLPRGIRIVHNAPGFIVIDKPPGLLTAGAPAPAAAKKPASPGAGAPNLFGILKDYARARTGPRSRRDASGEPRRAAPDVWIIHRLDKEASGLLVFAKNEQAFNYLKEEFRAKRVHRIYTVLVEGAIGPVGHAGTIQSFLREDAGGTVRSVPHGELVTPRPAPPPSSPDHDDEDHAHARDRHVIRSDARPSVTHYRVLAAGPTHTLLQVRLETGRKNQIRVHFSERGFPVAGDRRYGATTDPVGRLALHASELGFSDPATGASLRFRAPAPPAFWRAAGARRPGDTEGDATPRTLTIPSAPAPPAAETSWDDVASWYDTLLDDRGSDHHENVLLPGTIRLLEPAPGQRILDVACGQGILTRRIAALGASPTGVDASPRLVEAAIQRSDPACTYLVGDARELTALSLEPAGFDAAACLMALANIEPLEPLFTALATLLKPGARFVAVITHPAFRAHDQTSWQWDERAKRQYRRVDGYLSPGHKAVVMNPGAVARGEPPVTTITFHRPLQTYIRLLAGAGFTIDALEEWPAHRTSAPGPRAQEENRARREIPLFLALRAVRRA